MSSAAAAPQPWDLVVEADHVQVEADRLWGEGDVRLQLDGRVATAARFSLDRASGMLVLEDGQWNTSGGELRFRRAELDLGTEAGVLFQARYAGGGVVLTGERVTRVGPNTYSGTDAWLSACGCDAPPWTVEAREVRVRVDDVAQFRGGWLRVCGRRALPIPVGALPLSPRRSGLLPPKIGYGEDGARVGVPVMWVLGPHADAVVMPEWRQARGARGVFDGRYALAPGQGGDVQGATGWDTDTQSMRSTGQWSHGFAPGKARTAVDAAWSSDAQYLNDYGDDLFTRATPWHELRALAGYGPARVETQRFQYSPLAAPDAGPWRATSGVVAVQRHRPGGVQVGGRARMDLLTDDIVSDTAAGGGLVDDEWAITAGGSTKDVRLRGDVQASAGRRVGLTQLGAGVGLTGLQRDGAAGWTQGWVDAGVPVWADVAGRRWVGDVGVRATAAAVQLPRDPLPDEAAPDTLSVGPVLSGRWLGPRRVPLSAQLAAPYVAGRARVEPRGTMSLDLAPFTASAQADRDLAVARVVRDDGAVRAGLGLVASDALLVGSGELAAWLPAPADELRLGYTGLVDIDGWTALSQGPSAMWRSRCDCLTIAAGATWAADRDSPDVRLRVDLR